MYLWNRNFDRVVRVLHRLESFTVLSKKRMTAYEVRVEEIRAGLNADFAEAMAILERDDESRLRKQRIAWEKRNANSKLKTTKSVKIVVVIRDDFLRLLARGRSHKLDRMCLQGNQCEHLLFLLFSVVHRLLRL